MKNNYNLNTNTVELKTAVQSWLRRESAPAAAIDALEFLAKVTKMDYYNLADCVILEANNGYSSNNKEDAQLNKAVQIYNSFLEIMEARNGKSTIRTRQRI